MVYEHRRSALMDIGSRSLCTVVLLAGVGPLSAAQGLELASDEYEAALVNFRAGELREAAIRLRSTLQTAPDHVPSRILLGRFMLEVGAAAAAEKELRRALDLGADGKSVNPMLARAYVSQGKFEEALALLKGGQSLQTNAAALVIRGDALLGLGDALAAEIMYREALSLAPEDVDPLVGRATALLMLGKIGEAEALLATARGAAPENGRVHYLQGQLAQLRGDREGAVDAYTKALELDSGDLSSILNRATVLVELGRFTDAEVDLDRVRERMADEPQAAYLSAVILSRKGRLKEAEEALNRAAQVLDAVPADKLYAHPPTLLLAGYVAFAQRTDQKAISYLQGYLGRFSEHNGVRKRLGATHLRLGEPDQALAILSSAYERAPDDAAVLALLGRAHMQAGRHGEASALLERAGALAPHDPMVLMTLAENRLSAGAYDQAAAALESLQADPVLGSAARLLLGMIYVRMGEHDKAIAFGQEALERNASNLVAQSILASAYAGHGDVEKSREVIDGILAARPEYIPGLLGLAKLDIKEGRYEQAKNRYAQVLEIRPDDGGALLALAQLEEAMGNTDSAIRFREKLLAHHPDAVQEALILARLYLDNDQAAAARALAERFALRYRDDWQILLMIAKSELAMGEKDIAQVSLRRMSAEASYDVEQLHQIARLQSQAGDLDGAVGSLTKLTQTDPSDLTAWVALGDANRTLARYDDAMEQAGFLQKESPDDYLGYLLEAKVLLAQQNLPGALEAFRMAQEKAATLDGALGTYQVLSAMNQEEKAVRTFQSWAEAYPDDLDAQDMLGRVLVRSGQYDAARAVFERLVNARPRDPSAFNNLAMLYSMSDDGRALAAAQKAYALAPEDPNVQDTLGWILVGQGDPRAGLVHLRVAQAKRSDQPDIRFHLAVALHALGRDEEAKLELDAAFASAQFFSHRKEAESLRAKLDGR